MAQRAGMFVLLVPILGFGWAAQATPQKQTKEAQGAAKTPPAAPSVAPSPYGPRFAFGGNVAEVPATFSEDLVFLPVNLNGSEPSLFVLDTSASKTSIDPQRAEEIGIGANQPAALVLPGVTFPFSSLPRLARGTLAADVGRPYRGTIGADLLSRAVVVVDYARETVRIYDPRTYKYTGHGSVLPLSFRDGLPVIQAKFSTPKGKQVEAEFRVDTAMIAGVVISRKFSEAHHVFPK